MKQATSAMRILAAWLPNWPVQRLIRANAELESRPVILYQRARRGRSVAACSRAAGRLGVCVEMPLAEAIALTRQSQTASPKLHLEPYDAIEDRGALEKLAVWCHRFSPLVGLEEDEPAETLLLDIAGAAGLFGGPLALSEQVKQAFQRHRLQVRLGLANTVGAAWAMAHYGTVERVDAGDDDLEIAQHALLALPIEALRLPDEIIMTLARLGLRKIGDLTRLPPAELRARFGPWLLERLDQVFGAAPQLICPVHALPDFAVERLFEYPVDRRDAIDQAIRQLVQHLCAMLRKHNTGALELTCRFECQSAPAVVQQAVVQQIGCFRPSADAGHLLKLVEMHMERLRLPGPATGVSIRAARHARLITRQQNLLGAESSWRNSPQTAALVDRLAGRLGRRAVVRVVLQSDAQPEKALRWEPLLDSFQRQQKKAADRSRFSPLERPLRLLGEPVPLPDCVIETAGVVEKAGAPSCFRYDGRRYDVLRHWGPERIETGWWRRRGIRRDYYRVETAEGFRFWLFRRLRDGRWFLHGIFD